MPSSFDRTRELVAQTRFASIRDVSVTGSTNDDIARMLGHDQARGLTIVADYQEHGVGRKGRTWVAPPASSLLFTTALPEPLPASNLWIVPFWVALAVKAALAEHGVDASLQWPNDLLLRGRKLCGILCISRVTGASAWVGCGVGVNVTRPSSRDAADALAEISPAPAFCSDVGPVDREGLLATILGRFDAMLELLRTPQNVARRWEAAAGLPGARYHLLVDGEPQPFEAQALRLATGGSLIVAQDGRQREISLADARVLRE
ncbi:MAG: biotin--[acetyl-CoA-carboxylase] ligase [Vulcanimicrobiaceae bacterium]